MTISFAAAAAAILLLVIALATDLHSRTIPNRLTLPFLAGGLLFHLIVGGWSGAGEAALGGAAGFLPLFLLHMLGGIGGGDVKLFGAVGAWLGVSAVLQLMMASIVYGGIIGFILLASRRIRSDVVSKTISHIITVDDSYKVDPTAGVETAPNRRRERMRMPFMLAVLPAVVTVWPSFT
ncbi:A24 family peptidase [Paenibacillus sp. strain BS8-2]